MSIFSSFDSFSAQPSKCYLCAFYLDDGRPLLGHDKHGFHEDCIMAILCSNPTTQLACPVNRCHFVATRINGESIAMVLKFMGIKPVASKLLSQPYLPRREKNLFDLEGFMVLEGVFSSEEAGRALIIVAHENDDDRKIGRLLDFFHSKDVAIPQFDRGEAALSTMINGRFHPFQLLVQGDQAIDPDHFMSISMLAIKNNKPEFIRALWLNKQFDPGLQARLIKEAIMEKSFDIAREMLISVRSVLPSEYINDISKMAAQCGRKEILELLRKSPTDS